MLKFNTRSKGKRKYCGYATDSETGEVVFETRAFSCRRLALRALACMMHEKKADAARC